MIQETSRAIPFLNVYQEIKDAGIQVVMLCANNYPAKLQANFGIDSLFEFNGLVRQKTAQTRESYGLRPASQWDVPARAGLSLVEISDDCFGLEHLRNADAVVESGKLDQITEKARAAGLYLAAMGTGAVLSYAHVKDTGIAWAKFAKYLGIQIFTGRRPGTLNEKTFTEKVRLGDISEYVAGVSVIQLGDVRFGNLDADMEISKSEALNLALALEMNRRVPGVMQLVEQMQYAGMEPNTVEQVVRFNQFLRANLAYGHFGDMADHGHVGVRGTRLTTDPRDYDVLEFADAYLGPVVFMHHNILLGNLKQPGTRANIERDMKAQRREIPAKGMPHPGRIRDINDAVLHALDNPNVKLLVVSPEPKCDIDTDVGGLADDVAEAIQITASRVIETGRYEESDVLPYAFVTKGNRTKLDAILSKAVRP
jgi:hypothetical protein